MLWLEEFVRVWQADESGERVIVPAYSVEGLIDDIKERQNWNLTFWNNAIHEVELDKYRNRWDDRHNTKYILSLRGKEIPEWYDCHHAGNNIIEVVESSIHQGIEHRLKK
jgi:hypothetical protein